MIYIGTSGYSFRDWIGEVYPEDIKRYQMLKYYWSVFGFNAVELNFTYYRLPSYKTIVSMVRRTPDGFKFAVKVPSHVTHEGWKKDYDESVVFEYLKAMEPMVSEGRLLIHLAQFPYSFRYEEKNLTYIETIAKNINPLAVEFRHNSWNRDEVFEFLKEHEITYVTVDEPDLKELFPYKPVATSDYVYFRFHGRNQKWFEKYGDRYDYFYSDDELRTFAKDINKFLNEGKVVLVFFNNCHKGSAVKNALKIRELLGVKG